MDDKVVSNQRSRRALWVGLGVWIVIAGLVALFAIGGPSEQSPAASRILNQRVPAVVGTTMDDEHFDIDQHRGQWVAINFFATWCPGCVLEHPELVAFDKQAQANGAAQLVSIVFNDSADNVTEFFDKNGGDWPILQQPGLAVDFQVAQLPETFLVAPDGTVTHRFQGQVTAQLLWDAIDSVSRP